MYKCAAAFVNRKSTQETQESIYDGEQVDAIENPTSETSALDLRGFLATLGMEEHAEHMAAEGVSSLDDLKLVTEESQLEALGKSSHAFAEATNLNFL